MKYQTSKRYYPKRYLPNRDEMGHFKARPRYAKTTFILLLILFILGGIIYSIINAPAAIADLETEPVDNFQCTFINGGFACDDLSLAAEALSEYSAICEMDSVECEHERKKTIRLQVSAYTSEARQTDDSPEIGATGENIWHLLQKGIRACASNDFKFGTKLYIPGIGECVVKDRMNKRYTGKGVLDVYMGYDHAEAWKWGRKTVEATIK